MRLNHTQRLVQYDRLFMCGNARRRRFRWMVGDVVKSCDPSNR